MEVSQGPVTTDVIETFLNNVYISSVCGLQAHSLQVTENSHGQGQPLIPDINNVSSKPTKSNMDKECSTNDLPKGSIYKMFSEPASGSKLQLHQNEEFVSNITLNMVQLNYQISCINCSPPNSPPTHDDDQYDDNDQPQPCLIGNFQDEDDANTTNSRTVVFTNIDDTHGPPQEPDIANPPLHTPYTGGFAPAIYFIEIENKRCSVPYQNAPLASTTHCDCIVNNDDCLSQSHC